MYGRWFIDNVLFLDDFINVVDDGCELAFRDGFLELMRIVVGVETQSQFIRGQENNVLVFFLQTFHLLMHLLSHVGTDLNVDRTVNGSLRKFPAFKKLLGRPHVAQLSNSFLLYQTSPRILLQNLQGCHESIVVLNVLPVKSSHDAVWYSQTVILSWVQSSLLFLGNLSFIAVYSAEDWLQNRRELLGVNASRTISDSIFGEQPTRIRAWLFNGPLETELDSWRARKAFATSLNCTLSFLKRLFLVPLPLFLFQNFHNRISIIQSQYL